MADENQERKPTWPVSERAKAVEQGKGFQKFIAALLSKGKKK